MTALKNPEVLGFARVLYDWMLERGYMVDPEEGEVVADKVEMWDAVELLDRLYGDGLDVVEVVR